MPSDPAHTTTPACSKALQWRHGSRGRGGGHDRDPSLRQRRDQWIHHRRIGHTKAECVADDHLPLHPQGDGSFDDQLHRERAHLTRFVQMDIHAAPEFLGEAEHRVEMALWVAVDRTWIQPTHRLGTKPKRLLQQFHRARPHQQATLRERDEINIDDISQRLPRRHHTLDAGHATLCVHIHVTADEGAAMRDGKQRLTLRLLPRIDWQRLADIPLVLDLVDQARPHLVVMPRQAKQRFVEMGVGLHQARQRDASTAIQDGHAGRGRAGAMRPAKSEYPRVAAKRANVADKKISYHHPFPIRADQLIRIQVLHSYTLPPTTTSISSVCWPRQLQQRRP